MNKLKVIIILFIGLLGMASCSETDNGNEEYANWQSRNIEYFNSMYDKAVDSIMAGNPNWKILKKYTFNETVTKPEDYRNEVKTEYIVAHVLKGASADAPTPLYNDTVRIHYSGRLMPTVQHPKGFQFDASWLGDFNEATARPKDMALNSSLVTGFTTALLNMSVGDHWEVFIPQQLAYMGEKQSSIPAFSTLVFELRLVAFGKRGTGMPVFH